VGAKPEFRPLFVQGVAQFNATDFWHAHESWEELWLVAETDLVDLLQGLIQLTAAYHHVKRGTLRGAVRLFEAALLRMAPFPKRYCGIDRTAAEAAAREDREWAGQMLARGTAGPPERYPTLFLLPPEESPMPPTEPW
jgi:predicted metal-dependent hydrolase